MISIIQRICPSSIFDATSACRAALGPGIVVSTDVFDVTSACYAARARFRIVPVATSVGVGSVGRPVIAFIVVLGRCMPADIDRVVGVGSTESLAGYVVVMFCRTRGRIGSTLIRITSETGKILAVHVAL